MSARIERLKTPPPTLGVANGQLLTPPLTGGSNKRVRFDLDPATPSKRFQSSEKAEEYGLATYTELQESNDEDEELSVSIDTSEDSDGSPPPISSSSLASVGQQDVFADLGPVTEAVAVPEPFPLMKLPLSVRNRIYEFLLVIPALICVLQRHTSYHNEKQAYLFAEHRELLPGIAYALPQLTVNGPKFRFARFRSTNTNILQVSKKVHAEAKALMYGGNEFEIMCPCTEFSPPPNFKVHPFPPGYQRLVHHLNIRFRAFYPLQWLVNGGYAEIKNAYRGLETLTLIFEHETTEKGFAKQARKRDGEAWVPYVHRVRDLLAMELYGRVDVGKNMPAWINLRVLFDGDRYDEALELHRGSVAIGVAIGPTTAGGERAVEDALRLGMKRGLAEGFELFKR